MATTTERTYDQEFLVSLDLNLTAQVENVTLGGGRVFTAGDVVAISSSVYYLIDDGLDHGTAARNAAVGVVMSRTDASAADAVGPVLLRGLAVCNQDRMNLNQSGGSAAANRTTIKTALKALGIIVLDGIG